MAKTKKKTKQKAKNKPETIEFDAQGEVLGRLASKVAFYLQEKHRPSYKPNSDEGTVVKIKNAGKIKVSGKKRTDKIYWHYSGYPGGIYGRSFEEMLEKDPTFPIRKAVERMLPKNKMQKERLKRLKIEK